MFPLNSLINANKHKGNNETMFWSVKTDDKTSFEFEFDDDDNDADDDDDGCSPKIHCINDQLNVH